MDRAADVSIGLAAGLQVAPLAGHLEEIEPALGDLRETGQADPANGRRPVGGEAPGQRTVAALDGAQAIGGSLGCRPKARRPGQAVRPPPAPDRNRVESWKSGPLRVGYGGRLEPS